MPTITSIKPQKTRKRVNVYLDNKFGFGLDLESYMKLGLKVGQTVTETEIEGVVKKAEFQKTLDKLLRFATLRPRSEKEINDWLKKYKVHKSLNRDLFNRLKRLDLLDDKKFAQWWVEQRTSFRPRGKRVLSSELWNKGIAREIIDDVLSELKIDEEKIARQLLEKKEYKWEKLPRLEVKKKMGEFLARKGFKWSIIKKTIDDTFKKD
ncbi:RecX family transcriptional regulator [Patescibacteria group bacterium]|nr:RecX family transcriptional regulator [Patescibacteria group bacterium]